MVSVESGIGWIPFILETMDYELWENAPTQAAELSKMPSEYFARTGTPRSGSSGTGVTCGA